MWGTGYQASPKLDVSYCDFHVLKFIEVSGPVHRESLTYAEQSRRVPGAVRKPHPSFSVHHPIEMTGGTGDPVVGGERG